MIDSGERPILQRRGFIRFEMRLLYEGDVSMGLFEVM